MLEQCLETKPTEKKKLKESYKLGSPLALATREIATVNYIDLTSGIVMHVSNTERDIYYK